MKDKNQRGLKERGTAINLNANDLINLSIKDIESIELTRVKNIQRGAR